MSKKIHNNDILGQQGINLIEQMVLGMGFMWYPTGGVEAGIDGTIEIRNPTTGEVFNNIIQVQSKATGAPFTSETETSFTYMCKERDVEYWLGGNTPVILVVSRPKDKEIYWIPVKSYFDSPEKIKSKKVIFDKKAHAFSKECTSDLISLSVPKTVGLYLDPIQKPEELYSNLLEIKKLPEHIYMAETTFTRSKEVMDEMRRLGTDLNGEFILRNKKILSFHDLDTYPWNRLCDVGTLDSFGVDEWAYSEDTDRENEFRDLLNQSLTEMLRGKHVRFSRDHRLYHFTATRNLSDREYPYLSISKKTKRTVFGGYSKRKDTDDPAYYRHSAFYGKFLLFDDKWFLEITPTYHFTRDGFKDYKFSDDKIKKIKMLELNMAILGQVVMWSKLLQPVKEPNLFEAPKKELIEFGELLKISSEYGIDDSTWLPKEAQEDAPTIDSDQLLLNDL